MKNKGIVIFLIVLAVIIIAVMVGDYMSKRPDKMDANPYEFNVDEFKMVPEELIHYKEIKNFRIGFEEPKGLTIEGNVMYVVGDQKLQVIDISGKLLDEIQLSVNPNTIEVSDNKIFVASKNGIQVLNQNGQMLNDWMLADENSVITSVAVSDGNVFVADAGTRKIIRFTETGERINEFEGKASEDAIHGFIIPSPYFDMDINEENELWVVNPGLHELENYTFEGDLRTFWRNSTIKTEGFSGCCNPAHFSFIQDGSFVTSEKGLVRIKVYKPSGEFSGVVAAPAKFKDDGEAPDVAVDSTGNIYALDFDKKMIRVFERKI